VVQLAADGPSSSRTVTLAGSISVPRPVVKSMGEEEGRVLVRCRPYATFVTPPRHLHSNDQADPLTHRVSASIAWDAPGASDEP